MSSIRSQLRPATSAYRGARYPGDLAGEVLPAEPGMSFGGKRWLLFGGAGVGAAAALILSLLLSRASELNPVGPSQPPERSLASWPPIAPDRIPVPQFQAPSLPVRPPELRLPPGVEGYQDLAMQYRDLRLPESIGLPPTLRHTTVPAIPVDLPTRGVEWLHKVWTGAEKSA